MPVRFRQLEEMAGSVRFTAGGQFCPTLVMGVGGSGTNTARRVKRILDERYGPLGILRYLFADTDQAAYAPAPQLADTGPAEQASLVSLNAVQVYGETQRGLWPQISAFLPEDVDVGILRNADGAGGIRPVGRFALFSQFQRFYNNGLVTAVSDVLNVDRLVASALGGVGNRIEIRTEQPRVYLVNSICGGTGSSVFLDVALLIRYAFRQSQVEPAIIGLFYLPSVFRNERAIGPSFAQSIQANGYAGLKELEYFSDPDVGRRDWAFDYPGLGRVAVDGPLFDECYLVEGTNAQGQQLSRKEDVFEMAARSICVDIGSPVGARTRSALRNTSAVVRMHPCPETGKLRLMNSLATTSLVVPIAQMAQHGSLHAARRIIHDHMVGAPPGLQELENDVNAFLSANQLEERGDQDMLLERLLTDPDGNPLVYNPGRTRAQLEAEADASGHRGERGQAQHVAGWLSQQLAWLKSDGLAGARTTAGANRPAALQQATDAVRQQLARHIQAHGLAYGQAWLEELVRIFGTVAGELARESTEHEENQKTIEREIEGRQKFLADYGSAMDLLLRRDEDEKAMDAGLRSLQRYGSNAYRQVARQAALDLLSSQQGVADRKALLPQLEEWLGQVQSALAALGKTETTIAGKLSERQGAPESGSTYVLEQHLVPPSDYEGYCRRANLDHAQLAQGLWSSLGGSEGDALAAVGILAGYENRPEELADVVGAAAARDLMRFLEQEATVTQVIQRQKAANETEREHIERQLRLMLAVCQPFWTTRAPAGLPDYERFMAVTIPCRAADPQAAEIRQAVETEVRAAGATPELVDTDYPFALEITARAYGARAYYLGSSAQMKAQYEAKMEQRATRNLLHVDRRFGSGDKALPRLHPEPEEQAKLLFAWGLAYGYVAKHGDFYYLGVEPRLAGAGSVLAAKYETDWSEAVTDRMDADFRGPQRKTFDSDDQIAQGRTKALQQFVSNAQYVTAMANVPDAYLRHRGAQQVAAELEEYVGRLEAAIGKARGEDLRQQMGEERALLERYVEGLRGRA